MTTKKPTTVVIEIDVDGVRSVYSDQPNVRVIIVDHSWDDDILVSCPFPSPGSLKQCQGQIFDVARVMARHPDLPRAIPKTPVGSDA